MKKTFVSFAMLTFTLILFAGIARAHVVVFPKEVIQGSYEKFTVRVPTEKETPTVKVEVKIPDTVEISGTMPLPDWKSELIKDANGKVISVIWTTTAKGLSASQFGEFNMQGKINNSAASIVWKSTQTYKDGSVVDWVGDAKSDHPASVTAISKAPGSTSNLPLYLSIAAIVLSLLSLILAFKRKAR